MSLSNQKLRAGDGASVAQAHLLRPSKFADGRTRDWSLHVFFRILSKREMARSEGLLQDFLQEENPDKSAVLFELFKSEITHPRRMNPSKKEAYVLSQIIRHGGDGGTADGPNAAFLAWLDLVASANVDGVKEAIGTVLKPLKTADKHASKLVKLEADHLEALSDFSSLLSQPLHDPAALKMLLLKIASTFKKLTSTRKANASLIDDLLALFGKTGLEASQTAHAGGLPLVTIYELLRQVAVAGLADKVDADTGVAQPEAETDARLEKQRGDAAARYDSVPSNFVFTYAGLEALQLDDNTLRSFPDAFKHGMAQRAERLGDTGASAPENWEGELGQKSVHGYFTGGFQIASETSPSLEANWQRLRNDISDFNRRTTGNGLALRFFLNGLFRCLGLEVVHLELGQDPYSVEDGKVVRTPYRTEHFGFRDGISQPFVDLKLGAPPAGGGTPERNRSWAPVAAGEILLDQPDGDGRLAIQPAHPELREGSTFLVFRKLEQDVEGFHSFLAQQRPHDAQEQKKLAAQFMGRWQNGKSLVHNPVEPGAVTKKNASWLNDFIYAAEDPVGAKCPLGSHVRRSNPRDIGGLDDNRRHRLLRRGIPFGGSALKPGDPGDGEARGMLFICANARIDLQFEVVQAVWLNKDGFAGQSGLGRCPIAGANSGTSKDRFLESGAVAPVSRIPQFVTTKGGDYFFAPGIKALRKMAKGEKFRTKTSELPYEGESMGDGKTPTLFDPVRLGQYARQMVINSKEAVRVAMPEAPRVLAHEETASPDLIMETADLASPVSFVARHADAVTVMSSRPENGITRFSAPQYTEAGKRLLRGGSLLLSTDETGQSGETRARMSAILNAAWGFLHKHADLRHRMESITRRELNAGLARCASSGKIDLVDDLATPAIYAIVNEILGAPGPDWITEMAVSLPFARQHVGQVYPDWLKTLKVAPPANRGRTTLQIWGMILSLDIVGNYAHLRQIKALGSQAGAELLAHIDILIAQAAQDVPALPKDEKDIKAILERRRDPITLLDALLMLMPTMCKKLGCSPDSYMADVRGLMIEIVGTPMSAVPVNFANVMETVLDLRIDLPALVPILSQTPAFADEGAASAKSSWGLTQFIYEAQRLNPSMRLAMRRANVDVTLPHGGSVPKDDWAIAIIAAANLDDAVFPKAHRFSLDAYDNGPKREFKDYLLFGATDGARHCWGRDTIALHVMTESLRAASKLGGLTGIAGPNGGKKERFRLAYGMPARFSQLLGQV